MAKSFWGLMIVALLVAFTVPALAQESTVKGALSGAVYDSTGAVIPGAKVTLTGATGSINTTTDNGGNFLFPILTPGFYAVKVEKQGFKTSAVKAIEVATNKTSAIRLTMEPGVVSETVEVTANVATVDTSSAAVGANLTDSFYSAIPAPRNVAGLFYVAPGAVSSGGAGASNPSIAGGSGLENQYVADGVNITDGAFGGLGVFSRIYGSLSTGINLSFVQEVQVKSGGFEPQYGKSTGGIVQIVTKSGGNAYHGTVGAYFAPQDLEATRNQPDLGGNDPSQARFNLLGQVTHQAGFDIDGELGGYVPGFKNKLFFFGSFNPSWTRDYYLGSDHHGIPVTPGASITGLGADEDRATAYNYAGKITWKINENHTIEGSLFGDPTRTPFQNGTPGAVFSLSSFNNTLDTQMSYGTRNAVLRYNGTLSPTWLVNANLSWGHNYLNETPLNPGLYGLSNNINDPANSTTPLPDPATLIDPHSPPNCVLGNPGCYPATGTGSWDAVTPSPANCAAHGDCVTTGGYNIQGKGLVEDTAGDHYGFEIDTQKSFHFLGDHNFSIGYKLDRDFYDGLRSRTGGSSPWPTVNGGAPGGGLPVNVPSQLSGSPFGFDFSNGYMHWAGPAVPDPSLNSTQYPLWPLLDSTGTPFAYVPVYIRQPRGEFGNPQFFTAGTYHALYGMDSWSPWKYLTINAGLRWEQQYMQGTQDASTGLTSSYTWVGNWSPRIGVIVDPWGDRKTKISVNFARYNYAVPLDMAIRSLSTELDIYSANWLPHYNGEFATGGSCIDNPALVNGAGGCGALVSFNPDGTVPNPTLQNGWLLTNSPIVGLASQESIAPGTKMESLDEWVVGFEHDFGHGVIFSARYQDRRMKRIIEDMSGVSPEAANIGVVQQFLISNPNKKTDLFVNPIQVEGWDFAGPVPAQCIGFDNFYNPNNGVNTPQPIYVGQAVNASSQVVLPGGTPVAPGVTAGTGLCVVPQFDSAGNPNYPGGAEPGAVASDGIPEGFPNPQRNYQAFELEVNKSFSRNWQIRSNYRLARLKGNYEGAFRNDNNQTDPSISSLFDFTAGDYALLGDQFAVGYLNTDRRHVINTYFSYLFDNTFLKGLTIGTGLRVQTGVPINDLRAHPVYTNAGEVPIGGRGALGRLPTTGQVDVHLDYAMKLTERSKLHFGVDLFNIANMKRQTNIDQNQDRGFGIANADFLNPTGLYTGFQRPFYGRLMAKWEF